MTLPRYPKHPTYFPLNQEYGTTNNLRLCKLCDRLYNIYDTTHVKVFYRKGVDIPSYHCKDDGRLLRARPRNRGQNHSVERRRNIASLDSRPKSEINESI